jgi:hypothetical protein
MAEHACWSDRDGSIGLTSSPHVTAGAVGFASADGFLGISQISLPG